MGESKIKGFLKFDLVGTRRVIVNMLVYVSLIIFNVNYFVVATVAFLFEFHLDISFLILRK